MHGCDLNKVHIEKPKNKNKKVIINMTKQIGNNDHLQL